MLGKGEVPEFIGRGIAGDFTFDARFHIDAVNALPVSGKGETNLHLFRIGFRLRHALRHRLVPCLGLVHRQFDVPVNQHVIRDFRQSAPAAPFNAARRDVVFPQDATAFHDAPSCRFEGGINVLGTGLGFVHDGLSE